MDNKNNKNAYRLWNDVNFVQIPMRHGRMHATYMLHTVKQLTIGPISRRQRDSVVGYFLRPLPTNRQPMGVSQKNPLGIQISDSTIIVS